MKHLNLKAVGGFVLASVLSLCAMVTQGAVKYYNYFWTGAAGDAYLNTLGNWKQVQTTVTHNGYLFPCMQEDLVTMTNDVKYFDLTFTNGANQAVSTLDFNGYTISLTDKSSVLRFRNHSPLVLKNGVLKPNATNRYQGLGLSSRDPVDVTFTNMVISGSHLSGAAYAPNIGPVHFHFQDSFVTNFPCTYGTGSDSVLVYDNSISYTTGIGVAGGATNVTLRFRKGSWMKAANNAQQWLKTGRSNAGCRYIFEPGSGSNTIKVEMDGTNNLFAADNVTVEPITLLGYGNRADLHEVKLVHTPAAGAGLALSGTNNTITLSGDIRGVYMHRAWYNNSSKNARIEFADNACFNCTNGTSFLPYFRSANDPVFWVGTNCDIRIKGFAMNGYGGSTTWNGVDSTNALVYIGRGSVLTTLTIDYGGADYGFNGYNARIVMDNGKYRYAGFKNAVVVYRGVTLELNGDDAEFYAGYEATGTVPLQLGRAAGPHDLDTVLTFRPGPLGYNGAGPIKINSLSTSYMTSNTVIKVDVSDYIKDKTNRRHRIPLIRGNPSKWGSIKPDMEWLTQNLTIEPANDRVSNARIVYDADLNAISLAFDLNFGLMIIVR